MNRTIQKVPLMGALMLGVAACGAESRAAELQVAQTKPAQPNAVIIEQLLPTCYWSVARAGSPRRVIFCRLSANAHLFINTSSMRDTSGVGGGGFTDPPPSPPGTPPPPPPPEE